jgi:hypothetical protein
MTSSIVIREGILTEGHAGVDRRDHEVSLVDSRRCARSRHPCRRVFPVDLRRRRRRDKPLIGLWTLGAEPAEVQAACHVTIAAGEVPEYGIEVSHHTSCHRCFHALAFGRWLEGGGAGVPIEDVLPQGRSGPRPGLRPVLVPRQGLVVD